MELALLAGIACVVVLVVWLANRTSTDSSPSLRSYEDLPNTPDTDSKVVAVRSFLCGVAGESFGNSYGASRQEIIRCCRVGDPVQLLREPENRHDRYAIAVVTKHGMVGHVKAETASRLTQDLDNGIVYAAKIAYINGGTHDKPLLGLVLELTRFERVYRNRFDVEVIGERGRNEDGQQRQNLIATCKIGDKVTLLTNAADVAVHTANGSRIGSISKSTRNRVAELMNSNRLHRAEIAQISATGQVRLRLYEEFDPTSESTQQTL